VTERCCLSSAASVYGSMAEALASGRNRASNEGPNRAARPTLGLLTCDGAVLAAIAMPPALPQPLALTGFSAFLPAVFEGRRGGKAPAKADLDRMKELRRKGLCARRPRRR
jgi:hypothetical protein